MTRPNIKQGSFVAGKWYMPESDRQVKVVNPANPSETIFDFPAASEKDATYAIDVASEAFETWKNVPSIQRGRVIWRAAEIARRRLEEIAHIMSLEEGKIIRESRGEALKGISLLEYYAGEGFRMRGETLPSEVSDVHAYTIRRPLGVVGLITPWNFPWAIPVWKIAPALVAGNTVVFKPAELTPGTASIFVEILEEAGLPAGVLNMLVGSGRTVGEAIIQDPRIKAISFTGSNGVGMHINEVAAKRGARVTLEMGGKNAVIVMEDADLDAAASAIASGAFGATGQRCTATSRVIAMPQIQEELLERVVAKAKAMKMGAGLDESTDLAPAVDSRQFDTDLKYIDIAKADGAKLIYGGNKVDINGGYFVEPTIFANVSPDMRIFQEEVFGPVLSIYKAKSFEDAVRAANSVQYGLASAIFTQDNNRIMRFIEDIEVGMVHVNEPTIGGEAQLPFGGSKATGVGPREMGEEGINFFTEIKTVFINYSGSGAQASIR